MNFKFKRSNKSYLRIDFDKELFLLIPAIITENVTYTFPKEYNENRKEIIIRFLFFVFHLVIYKKLPKQIFNETNRNR